MSAGPQQRYKWGGFDSVWKWALGHPRRWYAAWKWAVRRNFDKQAKVYHRKWKHTKPTNNDSGWPSHMVIQELFNNDNGLHNHLHVASPDRDALLAIAKIAAARFGEVYVREFPPYDPVECVHVSTSWHYRDGSNPYTPRTCANRGNGCAFDLGAADRDNFGRELKARYGAVACDF